MCFNLRVSELAARYRVTVRTLENRCRKALGQSAGDILRVPRRPSMTVQKT